MSYHQRENADEPLAPEYSAFVTDDPDTYEELLKILDDDDFALKKEYIAVKSYLQKLKAGLTPKGDDLFDLL